MNVTWISSAGSCGGNDDCHGMPFVLLLSEADSDVADQPKAVLKKSIDSRHGHLSDITNTF
jgi:hypothetical protein